MSKRCSISSTELFTIVSEHLSKSIKLKDFLPGILHIIQLYLNCEQVFICYFNSEGEEEIITSESNNNIDNFQEVAKNYLNEENKLLKLHQDTYDSNDDLDINDITQPLLKSELTFPILIQTAQINSFLLQNLWGVLFIYDYNHSRKWKKREINVIKLVIKQIVVAIERNIIYEQLQLKNEQVKAEEIFDNLTRLPNYNSFIDCLEFEWFRLARERENLSLIMINMEIPHTYQEQVILPQIANSFLEMPTRISDLSARYSDTQFAIILPKTNQNGAQVVANRISASIQNKLFNYDNITFKISIISCIPKRELDYNIFLSEAEKSVNEAIENKISINFKEIT